MEAVAARARLEAAVADGMLRAAEHPMQWGRDDCALWAADILRGVLGYDPAVRFRGRYKTRRGAVRVLGRAGLLGATRAAARRHKWTRISPQTARPGDLGLTWTAVSGHAVLATVVCRATGWFVGRNEAGWTALPADDVVISWSVLPDWQPGARANLSRVSTRPAMTPLAGACHEPVSTAIGLTALITSLGASAGTAGLIGGSILSATLSIGFSILSSLLQPQRQSGPLTLADTSNAQSVQITERQSIPFKKYIVGEAFVGGSLFFERVKPPYLTMGMLLSEGPIKGVVGARIGTNDLAFSSIAESTILTPIGVVGQPDYPGRVKCSFRYGGANQAVDPLILQDYASIGAEFRQRSIATAVMRYSYGANDTERVALWGQVPRPNAYFLVRGVLAYDPRDPTHDLNNESTWTWTNNATLVQTWYLTRSFGGRIPLSRIDWIKTAASADYDDSAMACADGSRIKRHTIDGVITLRQKPYEVMRELLTANRGMVLIADGKVWVESSKPKSPIATIDDRILAGTIKYQSAKAKREQVNKLQVRFVAPDQEYQVTDGPILDRTDLQAADQEVLPATLALNYTQDHRRAQRLQKAFLDSSRIGATLTCIVDLPFLALPGVVEHGLIGNVVTFNSPSLFAMANGDYQVTGYGFSDDFASLSLALSRYSPEIETSWNPATDERAFVLADLNVS